MKKGSNKNELIEKRRRKMAIKRTTFILIVLLSILITLCLNLSYFNIQNIVVLNNKNVQKDEVIKLSNVQAGNNIFYINTKHSKENILSNPYVEDVKIKRKLPNKLEILVKEREVAFYGKKGNKFIIIDKNGVVLEQKDNIKDMDLIKLEGMDFKKAKIGEKLPSDDERKIKFIGDLTKLIGKMNEDCPQISLVDINNILDIKVYFGNICVIIGSSNEFQNKINKAINIINQNNIEAAKGYIDVSFDGNPVIFVEN